MLEFLHCSDLLKQVVFSGLFLCDHDSSHSREVKDLHCVLRLVFLVVTQFDLCIGPRTNRFKDNVLIDYLSSSISFRIINYSTWLWYRTKNRVLSFSSKLHQIRSRHGQPRCQIPILFIINLKLQKSTLICGGFCSKVAFWSL